ncbi:MAG: alpha/beta fold hydrolase [Boseongicola sp.]
MTISLILAAATILFAIATIRLADLREASAEATYPAEGQFVEVNGRKIHVMVKGQGPDLILIHGAGANTRDMELALAGKLEDRFRLFIVDRPGHGWSERLDPKYDGVFNTRAESPADQARALSQAVQHLGAENPIVLGHSFGGAVAMAWALEEPASAIVVLSGVTMPWPGSIDFSYRVLGSAVGGAVLAPIASAFVHEEYVAQILDRAFAPQSPPAGYSTLAAVPLATRIATLRANNRQVRALRPFIVEQSARYDEISLPVEVVHGTEDRTVFLQIHAEPLTDILQNAKLTVIEGVGHMPHHTVPDDIAAAIERAAKRAGLR